MKNTKMTRQHETILKKRLRERIDQKTRHARQCARVIRKNDTFSNTIIQTSQLLRNIVSFSSRQNIFFFQIILNLLLFLFKIQWIIEHAFVVICSEARINFSRHSMLNIMIDAYFVFSKLTSNVRICVDVFSKNMKFFSSNFESIIKDFVIAFDV
jgi:hypothetical protein